MRYDHRMLDLARKSMIAGFAPGEENAPSLPDFGLPPAAREDNLRRAARAASTGARAESPPSGRSTDSLGIANKRPHGVGHVRVDRRAGIVVEVHSAWHRAEAARNDSNAPLLGVGAFSHGLRGGYCPPAVILAAPRPMTGGRRGDSSAPARQSICDRPKPKMAGRGRRTEKQKEQIGVRPADGGWSASGKFSASRKRGIQTKDVRGSASTNIPCLLGEPLEASPSRRPLPEVVISEELPAAAPRAYPCAERG